MTPEEIKQIKNDLLNEAGIIRHMQEEGGNTADRVGVMLQHIIDHLFEGDSGSGGGSTPAPGGDYLTRAEADTKYLNVNGADTDPYKATFTGGIEVRNTNGTPAINVTGNIIADGLIQGSRLESTGTIEARGTIKSTNGDVVAGNDLSAGRDIHADNGTVYAKNVQATNAVFDFLTVNKRAHFAELIIDQLRANNGAIIISRANCKVDHVETITKNVGQCYRVYFKSELEEADGSIRVRYQSFIKGDQAICQSLGGGVKAGINSNVTTTYYWRLVDDASNAPVTTKYDGTTPIDTNSGKYHWIDLCNYGDVPVEGEHNKNYDCNSGAPKEGDEIVQLGFRNYNGSNLSQSEVDSRQTAIVLSAYNIPQIDPGVKASFVAFYNGINIFQLSGFRGTYFDATGAHIVGTLEAGSSLDPRIEDIPVNVNTYQFIVNPNPIIKSTSSQNVYFKVLHTNNNSGEIITTADGLTCKCKLNNDPEDVMPFDGTRNAFTLELDNGATGSGEVTLYGSSNTDIKAKYLFNIVDLGNVTNGVDGKYYQRAYGNFESQPQTPQSVDGAIPTGWYSDDDWEGWTPPTANQKTYMIERLITPQAGGGFRYGQWSYPMCISGPKGADGQGTVGPQGPQGEQGDKGDDGVSYVLVPLTEKFEVIISKSPNASNTSIEYDKLTGIVYTDLQYQVYKIEGDVATALTRSYLINNNYCLTISDNVSNNIINIQGSDIQEDSNHIGILQYAIGNYLENISGGNQDYEDYYNLYRLNATDYMVTNLTVELFKDSELLESKNLPLIFEPKGHFISNDVIFQTIYQGFGSTNSDWRTGFSEIRQTWDEINLSVNDIQRYDNGTDLPNDTSTVVYRFKGQGTIGTPDKPADSSTSNPSGWGTNRTATSTLKYVYYIRGIYKNELWIWTYPKLYAYWDGEKSVLATSVNSGELQIKSDEIDATVTRVDGLATQVGNIEVTAQNISLSVTEQTKGNKNYLMHPGFTDENLTKEYWTTTDTGLTAEKIIHSVFRFAAQTSCPQVIVTPTNTNSSDYTLQAAGCAMLSSYVTIPMDFGSTSPRVQAYKNISFTGSNNPWYTFSIWVKRALYIKNKTCVIRLGVGNSSSIKAKSITITNKKSAYDSSNAVEISINSGYVDFTLKDNNWHQLIMQFKTTAATNQTFIALFGSNNSSIYREVFVSRPLLCQGEAIPATDADIDNNAYIIYRLIGKVPNLLDNGRIDEQNILNSSSNVNKWAKAIYNNGTGYNYNIVWDGTQISVDNSSQLILDKLYSTSVYPGAIQIANTVAALKYDDQTSYRIANQYCVKQKFDKEFASQLQNEWLVYSVYVKKLNDWKNKVCYANDEDYVNPLSFALRGEYIDKSNIEIGYDTNVTPSERPDSLTAVNGIIRRFTIPADGNWYRIWWKFKLDTTTNNDNALLKGFVVGVHTNVNRDNKSGVNVGAVGEDYLISRPKLEIGTKPSMWTDNNDDINEGLKRTGIDISSGVINLQADKVTFSDSHGGNTDKITINPETGTLNAVDGVFSGTITANILQKSFASCINTSQVSSSHPSGMPLVRPDNALDGDLWWLKSSYTRSSINYDVNSTIKVGNNEYPAIPSVIYLCVGNGMGTNTRPQFPVIMPPANRYVGLEVEIMAYNNDQRYCELVVQGGTGSSGNLLSADFSISRVVCLNVNDSNLNRDNDLMSSVKLLAVAFRESAQATVDTYGWLIIGSHNASIEQS